MTQRNRPRPHIRAPKGAPTLPTPHVDPDSGPTIGREHRFVPGRLVGHEPFSPFAVPSLPTRRQPFANIHHRVLWLLSPSPPLYRASFVSRARPGSPNNGTEQIRWFGGNGAYASRLVRAIFNNYFDTPRYFPRGFATIGVCRERARTAVQIPRTLSGRVFSVCVFYICRLTDRRQLSRPMYTGRGNVVRKHVGVVNCVLQRKLSETGIPLR